MPQAANITLVGHLAADPETRYSQGGTAIANLRIPVNDGRPKRDGQGFEEHTSWYRVTLFGKQAEKMAERGHKGMLVQVIGKLSTSIWIPDSGEPRVNLDVEASSFLILERSGAESREPGRQASLADADDGDPDMPF